MGLLFGSGSGFEGEVGIAGEVKSDILRHSSLPCACWAGLNKRSTDDVSLDFLLTYTMGTGYLTFGVDGYEDFKPTVVVASVRSLAMRSVVPLDDCFGIGRAEKLTDRGAREVVTMLQATYITGETGDDGSYVETKTIIVGDNQVDAGTLGAVIVIHPKQTFCQGQSVGVKSVFTKTEGLHFQPAIWC